jgi:hypothetical protein
MPVEHLSPKKSVVAGEKTLDPDKIAANQPHTSLRLRLGHQEGRGSPSSLHDFRGSHVQNHIFKKKCASHTKVRVHESVCLRADDNKVWLDHRMHRDPAHAANPGTPANRKT